MPWAKGACAAWRHAQSTGAGRKQQRGIRQRAESELATATGQPGESVRSWLYRSGALDAGVRNNYNVCSKTQDSSKTQANISKRQ